MADGTGVIVAASVGVSEAVIVGVKVGVPSAAEAMAPRPMTRMITKTKAAPMIRNTVRSPNAAGRLRVISGMWLARTVLAFLGSTVGWSSVPQTRQRVAFSARRVPQVGQTFVIGVDGFSGLIRGKIIPF